MQNRAIRHVRPQKAFFFFDAILAAGMHQRGVALRAWGVPCTIAAAHAGDGHCGRSGLRTACVCARPAAVGQVPGAISTVLELIALVSGVFTVCLRVLVPNRYHTA